MIFSSHTFLFFFLPVLLALYFLAPKRARNGVLLFASLVFYAWGEAELVAILIGSCLVNYGLGWAIASAKTKQGRVWTLAAGVALNLGLLCTFKYLTFLVQNAAGVLGADAPQLAIRLPMGISFFTFQALSYLVDLYRGDAKPQRSPVDFSLYIALFPQLIAGPILRYTQLAPQLGEREITQSSFAYGVTRLVCGLGKKALIADPLSVTVDAVFALPADHLTASLAWAGVACYTLQIYFDFSGYSDMAIGLGRMLGFKIPENFLYPYVSQSVTEFWRRWHVSLSTWFRDYLYIPLGGNRREARRTYLNLVIVFVLCGLWHGAAWRFLFWGVYHGVFLVIERRGLVQPESWPRPLRHAYLLLVVMVGWIFFRAETFSSALAILGACFGFGRGDGVVEHLALHGDSFTLGMFVVGLVGSIPWLPWVQAKDLSGPKGRVLRAVGIASVAVLFWVSVAQVAGGSVSPFVYFRF